LLYKAQIMTLNGPLALITGASSGIGKALAENFAEHGYDVILSARSVAKMEAHAAELGDRFGVAAHVIAADLESPAGPAELHAEIRRRGLMLNALVNNAGYGTFGEFKHMTLESQLGMMQLNMTSLVALAHLFLPDLVARRSGRIMNVASTAAFQPGPLMAVYYATKAYVLSFSEALAEELRGTGVTVTALCPGPTATGFSARAHMQDSGLFKGLLAVSDARSVARAGYEGFRAGKRIVIPGLLNKMSAQSSRLTPRGLMTRVVKGMQARRH